VITIYRTPEWDDIPQLLEIGRKLHEEGWYSHISYNTDKVAVFFVNRIMDKKEEHGFCKMAVVDGDIVGVIAGQKTQYWFSEDFGTFDNFLYVVPEKRGSRIAFCLWNLLLEWSKKIGAVELSHGVGTAIKPERADKFFRGMGMTHVGGIYKLKIDKDNKEENPC
jgi:GNAT superfamily N-acetyltransferase